MAMQNIPEEGCWFCKLVPDPENPGAEKRVRVWRNFFYDAVTKQSEWRELAETAEDYPLPVN